MSLDLDWVYDLDPDGVQPLSPNPAHTAWLCGPAKVNPAIPDRGIAHRWLLQVVHHADDLRRLAEIPPPSRHVDLDENPDYDPELLDDTAAVELADAARDRAGRSPERLVAIHRELHPEAHTDGTPPTERMLADCWWAAARLAAEMLPVPQHLPPTTTQEGGHPVAELMRFVIELRPLGPDAPDRSAVAFDVHDAIEIGLDGDEFEVVGVYPTQEGDTHDG